jgi:biotin-(acetyl-CoA carboxylase) ligase
MNDYADVDIHNVLSVLMKKLDKSRNTNFAVVRERWMDLAAGLNKTILYRGKPAELIGLNEDGALVLRCDTRYILTYGDEISI